MKDAKIKRRSLLQSLSMLAVGSGTLVKTGSLRAAVDEATQSVKSWPQMEYRDLGKTGFNGSRLVFGCGAALMFGQANDLLEPALESGINVFDVGYRDYYRNAEENLAPFLKKHRDEIFLISKAPVGDIGANDVVTVAAAKQAAKVWLDFMDASLKELQVEHVDAYYLMASNNTTIIRSEEMYAAFSAAKHAGKVSHWGLSTHENAQDVLLAAAETGWYSLAQIAITPGGWYDWESKQVLKGSKDMIGLKPVLDTAREAGIGLIGMKAGRHLAGKFWLPWGNSDTFDKYYSSTVMQSKLNEFQRSYAYVLSHGLDAVNADMWEWQHMRENFIAATTAQTYFV
ncbi:MAG TPA: aldo/keto reductase [Gammaproteobacteria bacterium]|nr:aldo/keto reductase [Gammaproteobacteria bacterium]